MKTSRYIIEIQKIVINKFIKENNNLYDEISGSRFIREVRTNNYTYPILPYTKTR